MAGETEVAEQTEEQANAALAEGFGSDAPAAAAPASDPAPEAEPAPAEPEFVQITKQDHARLMAAAEKVETVDAQFNKVFGTIGNVKNELTQRLQSMTPAGASVEITDEDFAELKEDFPELAGHTRAALERILKRTNLKGTGQPATQMDPEQVRVAAQSVVHAEGLRDLDDLHPGWRDIVGKPDDADNAYRKWLATQTPEYQALIRSTYSAAITSRSIDRFKASQTKPAKPAAKPPQTPAAPGDAQRARLHAAVQPRGNGATPPAPRPPTPEENLAAGFNS